MYATIQLSRKCETRPLDCPYPCRASVHASIRNMVVAHVPGTSYGYAVYLAAVEFGLSLFSSSDFYREFILDRLLEVVRM
jgi:hypothetical protein